MKKNPSIASQRGAVLIVSLLFLVVLTMLGVTAMTSTTFEERMAGNARDAAVAHQAAEAALHRARDEIDNPHVVPNRDLIVASFMPATDEGNCVDGVCQARKVEKDECCVVPPDIPANVRWTTTSSTTKQYVDNSGKGLNGVSSQPRYIIELFCFSMLAAPPSECRIYRFTAVGWGKNPNTQVTVQEIFLKRSEVKL